MNVRVFLMIPVAALVVACGRNIVAPADNSATRVPPTITSAKGMSFTAAAVSGRDDIVVNIHDACDPDTFNEALQNPEACVRAGGVKFDQFVIQLTRLGFIGP